VSIFESMMKQRVLIILALGASMVIGCSDDDDDNNNTDPSNHAPVVSSVTSSVSNADFGQSVTITCNASDADGDDLAYSWTLDGSAYTATTAQFDWTAPEAAGTHTFAVTVSDGMAVATGSVAVAVQTEEIPEVEILSGTIIDDMTLTNDRAWLLRGGVFVGDDVNETILTVQAGTTIYGESSTDGMLVVRRGSKLVADGTASAPIVFTSDKEPGNRGRSDWGGLIINGRAPLNSGDEAYGEGGTGGYGGSNSMDDSGILRYVRVEFAGREISPDNELNGIAFQGVGSGTTVDYVQVHMGKDDGVEFFGGTVNVKHVVVTGAADDSFDWTDGWQGKGQFLVVQHYGDDADQGIEADNSGEDNDAMPRSMPQLYNLTMVGDMRTGPESDIGMLLREGTGAHIYNAIVLNFGDCGIDIDHEATFVNATDDNGATLNGNLVVDYSIFHDNNSIWQTGEDDETIFTSEAFISTLNAHNHLDVDPLLTAAYDKDAPDFTPTASSPAIGNGMTPPNDGFFDQVDYIGAMSTSENWMAGWTTSAMN
jgi:hypothetical protein